MRGQNAIFYTLLQGRLKASLGIFVSPLLFKIFFLWVKFCFASDLQIKLSGTCEMNTLDTSLMAPLIVESFGGANTHLHTPSITSEPIFKTSTTTPKTRPNAEIISRDITPIEDLILHRATLSAGKLIFKGRLVRE